MRHKVFIGKINSDICHILCDKSAAEFVTIELQNKIPVGGTSPSQNQHLSMVEKKSAS